ncbi:MAG TPA: hypothetical protein VFW11_16795 [Cyclobacteriaceae bacterium]|nr:hypothetical protein [Cyclobacteriaceae bacterium]
MKKLLLVIGVLFFLSAGSAQAQTWSEWFRQKKTQKKYLVKQIALLKLYGGYLKEGYDIVGWGLTTIHDIRSGEFSLHRDFFGSLKNVNPRIANSAKVVDIIALQAYIVRDIRNVNNFCKTNEQFTPEEIQYVASVHDNILLLVDASISGLLMVIRNNETEMRDDERLLRLDMLYDDMQDKYAFVRSFASDVRLIAGEREREQRNDEILRKAYDAI